MPERLRFERELSDLGLSEVGKPKVGLIEKNVILVAGFDYEFSGAEFSEMCDRRMRMLVKRHVKLKLKFTVFDVGKGTVKSKEIDSRGKIKETLIKSFDAISKTNYDMTVPQKEKVFVSGANVMSILDIYKHIQNLGKTEPASLIEFSIFSHGWDGGPILVNSDRNKPDDKDARPAHFNNSTRVSEMKAAFDKKDGIIWLWGCNFYKAFLIIFAAMRRSGKYKSAGLKDSVKFTLDFQGSGQRFIEVWNILDNAGSPPLKGGLISFRVNKTFEDIKKAFILKGLENTFSQKMAVALGGTVFGALPGTYSDYEKGGKKLMLVPRKKPPYDDNFSSIISFYKTYFGIEMAPENRGYAKYPF